MTDITPDVLQRIKERATELVFGSSATAGPEVAERSCRFCGLLAYFEGEPLRIVRREVSLTERMQGVNQPAHCMADAFRIESEQSELARTEDRSYKDAFRAVTEKLRRCREYQEHRVGETPQEALRRHDEVRLETERRAHDLKLAEMTLRSQQSLETIMTAHKEVSDKLAMIAERSEGDAKKFQGTDTIFKWAFGILAALTLLVGVVPVCDRATGLEPPVRVTVTVPQPTPSASTSQP